MANSSIPMYPFKRLNYSKPWHQIVKAQDYLGVLCPECFHPIVYRAHVQLNIQHIDKMETSSVELIESYKITCPDCGNVFIWEGMLMDPNIAPILSILNKKGWFTIESCEGNKLYDKPENDLTLDAYIWFKHPKQKAILDHIPLQGKWYLDQDHPDDFIIRCPSAGTTIRERMAWIRRWAKALPEIFDDYVTSEMIDSIDLSVLNEPDQDEVLEDGQTGFKDAPNGYTESIAITRHYNNIAKETKEEQRLIKKHREKNKPTFIPDLPKEVRQAQKEQKRQERRAINKQKRELRKQRREAQRARDLDRNRDSMIAQTLERRSSGWENTSSRPSGSGRPVRYKTSRHNPKHESQNTQTGSSTHELVPNYAHKKNSPKKYKTVNRFGKAFKDLT